MVTKRTAYLLTKNVEQNSGEKKKEREKKSQENGLPPRQRRSTRHRKAREKTEKLNEITYLNCEWLEENKNSNKNFIAGK